MRRPRNLNATAVPKSRSSRAWSGGSSRKWRKLRQSKLDADPLCEPCRGNGKVTEAVEVHHRVPLSQGGDKWAWGNLESRCGDCHIRAHGGAPRTRTDVRGYPIGDHPWNV